MFQEISLRLDTYITESRALINININNFKINRDNIIKLLNNNSLQGLIINKIKCLIIYFLL
jgi:hypothetical protein